MTSPKNWRIFLPYICSFNCTLTPWLRYANSGGCLTTFTTTGVRSGHIMTFTFILLIFHSEILSSSCPYPPFSPIFWSLTATCPLLYVLGLTGFWTPNTKWPWDAVRYIHLFSHPKIFIKHILVDTVLRAGPSPPHPRNFSYSHMQIITPNRREPVLLLKRQQTVSQPPLTTQLKAVTQIMGQFPPTGGCKLMLSDTIRKIQ